ncbi:FecCD family ABC transporter permease [Colwellia psychrerythraea]|uniref:ABC-type transporter, integral membrane subunit n=1 Tax=Colwellia psychrerythraea TaxID=28229 RepID=A0A099KM01_COLPS|nr:iron ABC transporter permease [Colwellia psychrerythraea]KGJ91799.1 ABC-type transporter, integral membrane subunit [Colwellia psychrerythraea]
MNKVATTLLALTVLVILSAMAAITFGPADIDSSELITCLVSSCQNPIANVIIWQVRIPRILVALVAGMGLAIAGAILQNTTRNPLADPYLFGIVSGAGLGATIANISLADNLTIALPLAAFLGALFSVIIVVFIAKVLQRMEQLLLAGVAVSFMLASITQFILYFGEPFATNRVIFWLMGSLARVEMSNFYVISSVLIVAIITVIALHRQIDALLLGDESAASLGVDVDKLRLLMLGICAALTATIVAYCGGIGFVGLMIPHIVRQLIGVTTLKLIIGSALIGAIFLIWVDVIARSSLPHAEIPIGIITSALGSIFFLFIMYRSRAIS